MNSVDNISLRKFTINDYEAVVSIWEKSGLPYKPEGRDRKEKINEELKHETSVFLIAEIQDKIVGVIFGTHDGRKGWINRVAVDPDFQKKGIAAKLVEEVEKIFDKIGIEITAALIEDWNKTSMKVFQKLGYVKHNDVFYFSKRKNPNV